MKNVNYLSSVDEPANVSGRKGVVAGAVECNAVTRPVMVAFIAGNHREPFGQTYHGQYSSGLDELERG